MKKIVLASLLLVGSLFANEGISFQKNNLFIVSNNNVTSNVFRIDDISCLTTNNTGEHYVVLKQSSQMIRIMSDQTFVFIAQKVLENTKEAK
ncbi:hypothetical protein [Sulfurospirillum multivorans]|uniref:Periplasmic protein n=2 Tax=Sulfurospirillum multivorans TaxID=66821 RepID=A0AA86ALM4_SULMK|nr:hypothetical protein [Sulfurospirillum multivorans]AHJ13100.1 hypothetical protein SMUL_1845 [Sulfurospirillum multivorans DSM 12446]QEH06588.1 hypothetical protein SMN_1823 [Sulfurospirillum multivorans]